MAPRTPVLCFMPHRGGACAGLGIPETHHLHIGERAWNLVGRKRVARDEPRFKGAEWDCPGRRRVDRHPTQDKINFEVAV